GALAESGRRGVEHPSIDLKRYGNGRLDAEFKSKMLGQNWHFHANVKAEVASGGVVDLEPEAEVPSESGPAGGADAKKFALGKLGYAYDEEMFYHAVADANLEAVRLFLQIGMSPNAHGKGDEHPMIVAAGLCAHDPKEKPRSAVVEALVAAGGDVKVKD